MHPPKRHLTNAILGIATIALLAGCTSTPNPHTPSRDAQATNTPTTLCELRNPAGDLSATPTVEGPFGQTPQLTFDAPLDITEEQTTVLIEGDGKTVTDGELLNLAVTAYHADTGALYGSDGYNPGEVIPKQLTTSSEYAPLLGCPTIGTRTLTTRLPHGDTPGLIYIIDVLGTVPGTAWGEPQTADPAGPQVTLAADGAPTITVPHTAAPGELTHTVLKKGDGLSVETGDTVLIKYTGVNWADGETIETNWPTGAPSMFTTDSLMPGLRDTLEGATIGSQLLATIPAAAAYGETGDTTSFGQGNHEHSGKTLVFVIDLLGVEKFIGE